MTVLTDNMKTVVLDRIDGQPRFHPKDAGLRQLLRLRAKGDVQERPMTFREKVIPCRNNRSSEQ
ncbi:hypothetical protein [Edaphobacter aggregans]|uniref:hypothetical protein n=1 Tax=Edaphobacter aggregans TaxID=570835 RepID=UPI001B804324|nr:hypothetical protein [Edaphobacter aggregans]